jgi:hypothetical protein
MKEHTVKHRLPVDLSVANSRSGYLRAVTLALVGAALCLMPATAQAQGKDRGTAGGPVRGTEIVVAKQVQGAKQSAASQRAARGAVLAGNARLRAQKARVPKSPLN